MCNSTEITIWVLKTSLKSAMYWNKVWKTAAASLSNRNFIILITDNTWYVLKGQTVAFRCKKIFYSSSRSNYIMKFLRNLRERDTCSCIAILACIVPGFLVRLRKTLYATRTWQSRIWICVKYTYIWYFNLPFDWLIDWFFSVLRHIGNVSAI